MANQRPEDEAALWRRERGLSRVAGVFRDDQFFPHSSGGAMRGHSIVFRQKIVSDYQQGRPVLQSLIRSDDG